MTNLGIAGGISLRNINQWISVIDTNLTNSKRIGYKETSVSMTSGEVGRYGTTQSIGKIQDITFPSASLEIGKTQILDYVQGNLTQTGQVTDFALSGRGYFVVEDNVGNKYATRDGQFNFDTDGYLVTAEGLRVLTTGLDYIRVPGSENFAVNSAGESQALITDSLTPDLTQPVNQTFNPASNVSSLSQSMYGTKKLLVIDIPTSSKLIYSKYGYTKFDLGTKIPIRVQNDFSFVTDGINTGLTDRFNATGTNLTDFKQYFKHDVKNGTMKMSTHVVGGTANRYVQASLTSQKVKDFNASIDFNIRDNAGGFNTSFGLTVGKSLHTVDDQGNAIFVGVSNGQLLIRRNGVNIAGPVGFAGTVDPPNATTLSATNTFSLKVDSINGVLTASVFQNGALISGPISVSVDTTGYMGIGTSANPVVLALSSSSASDNVVDITNIDLVERNKDSEYVTNIIQKNKKDILKNGLNANAEETQVMQQNLEESTSTIADTLPLLSNTQKLFSAVSKIISVYNSITDDINNTVR